MEYGLTAMKESKQQNKSSTPTHSYKHFRDSEVWKPIIAKF